jgi:hypothetical protein
MKATFASKLRKLLASPFVAGLLVSTCVFALCVDDANAGRGGGGRGGGGGMSRGGGGGSHGGRMAQSSVSGGNRGGGARSGGGSGARASDRGGGGGRTADRGGGSSGARASDRGGSRSTERNGGDRTRTSGDRETNIGSNNNVNIEGRDVNIDVEGGWGGGCCYNGFRHPVAAGITIGAIATSVAVAAGSYYYALPPSGCVTVVQNGASYYQCGSAYYQEAMDGDEVVYVSVEP